MFHRVEDYRKVGSKLPTKEVSLLLATDSEEREVGHIELRSYVFSQNRSLTAIVWLIPIYGVEISRIVCGKRSSSILVRPPIVGVQDDDMVEVTDWISRRTSPYDAQRWDVTIEVVDEFVHVLSNRRCTRTVHASDIRPTELPACDRLDLIKACSTRTVVWNPDICVHVSECVLRRTHSVHVRRVTASIQTPIVITHEQERCWTTRVIRTSDALHERILYCPCVWHDVVDPIATTTVICCCCSQRNNCHCPGNKDFLESVHLTLSFLEKIDISRILPWLTRRNFREASQIVYTRKWESKHF